MLKEKNQTSNIKTERDVLTGVKNDWLVHAAMSFQDSEALYLVMEYLPGGDLRALLISNETLAERYAKFYVAEMIMAVNELHKLGYIHRDLKPENFLIDKYGHVKLTDFGLSKGGVLRTYKNSLKKYFELNANSTIVNPNLKYKTLSASDRRKSFRRSKAYSSTSNFLSLFPSCRFSGLYCS